MACRSRVTSYQLSVLVTFDPQPFGRNLPAIPTRSAITSNVKTYCRIFSLSLRRAKWGGVDVGGSKRVDLSFYPFPCFAVFGGSQATQMLGKKQHEKCHWHTPFCVPQTLRKIANPPYFSHTLGVDPKWGRFPICPEMSRLAPGCPLLSRFVPVPTPRRTKEDKRGENLLLRGPNWGLFLYQRVPH